MPQGVQRDALVDLRHLRGGVTGAIELARGHRLRRIAAREQPALRARRLPPGAQQREQARPGHDVTILAALALLDANDQASREECDYVRERPSGRRLRDACLIRCGCKLGLDLSNLLPDEVRHKARTWREMPS